ncbi:hypothetical protein FOG51_02803 [Hanseniaspora uvarum]|nr:hypothetical protein FOG51_02803 [Hanseniaspora uvarum]GMM42206.1 hydroxymethylglutaryl-CoA reductase (NADPH) [Hanseniaspora uvarum]
MPLLFKKSNVVGKPLAEFSRFAAKHPFQIILSTLLLTAFAYVRVIEYFKNGWSLDTGSVFHAMNLNQIQSKQYLYNSSTDSLQPLSLTSGQSSSNVEVHSNLPKIYVTELEFKSDVPLTCPIEEIDEIAFGSTSNSRFIVQSQFDIPYTVSINDTVYQLRPQRNKLLQFIQFARFLKETFVAKLQTSDPTDIFVISSAYLGMFYTFVKLFYDMRNTGGSKIWIGLFSLVSSGCALFLALYFSVHVLEKPVTLLSLIEGLPFIVIIIGFKHKVKLAEFTLKEYSKTKFGNKTNVPSVMVYHAMLQEGGRLIQDYAICLATFVACAALTSFIEILQNFSYLVCLILILDLIITSTFFCSILSLKLEIRIINRSTAMEQVLEEDGVLEETAEIISGQSEIVENASIFTSHTIITFFKLSVLLAFVFLHFYNFGYRWTYETFNSLYPKLENDAYVKSLLLKDLHVDFDCIAVLVAKQYYEQPKLIFHVEDYALLTYNYISLAIRDKYLSKFVLICFLFSCSINVYLLNNARIHTSMTVKKFLNKKSKKNEPVPQIKTPINVPVYDSQLSKNLSLEDDESEPVRSVEEALKVYKEGDVTSLNNREVVSLVVNKHLPLYALEKQLKDTTRAVVVRRKALAKLASAPLLETESLPYRYYDYDRVFGACCENVIGFMPLPVGVIGPMIIDDVPYHIPMATTEGCLVASAMRGCKAINAGGGVTTVLTKDGMTRGPCVRFGSLKRSGMCKIWIDSEEGQNKIKKAFNSTSRFARLQNVQTALAGDLLFLRFRTTTGDAMGMNMISKGVEYALKQMVEEFGWNDMEVVSVSGNYCMDKKPGAINWIEGRGKSVVAEATIPKDVVSKVLKSEVKALVELNISKNLIGSAMAGSVGGFNAHASNLVTAVFLALGQDPAQNVESSNCITLMKETLEGDLRISVSMPSIEVGTIGGGTILGPQGSMLDLLGVRGPHPTEPGTNSRQLAKIVASAVLAGELSLCSALAAGHLVQSHMVHNRAKPAAETKPPASAISPNDLQVLKEGSVTCIKS